MRIDIACSERLRHGSIAHPSLTLQFSGILGTIAVQSEEGGEHTPPATATHRRRGQVRERSIVEKASLPLCTKEP